MDAVKEWWTILGAIVASIFWLARLEAKVGANSRELIRIEGQMERDRKSADAARAETNEMLREVRSDIKTLIGRDRVIHWNDKTQPPKSS